MGYNGVDEVCDLLGLSKAVHRQDLAEISVKRLDLGLQVDVVLANLVAGALNLSEFVVFGYCHGVYLFMGWRLDFGGFTESAECGDLASDCRVPAIS